MFLISCEKYEHAVSIAQDRNLKRTEWLYVPWEPKRLRSEKLVGRHNVPKEKLIGFFSNEEIEEISLFTMEKDDARRIL